MAKINENDINQLSDNDAISDISDPDDNIDNNNNTNTKESIMSEIDNMLNELEITSNTTIIKTQNNNNNNDNNSSNETTKLNNSRFIKNTDNCENDSKAIQLRNKKNNNTNRLDSIRYSMHTLQNSQPSDIDALLNELCQLENNLNDLPTNNIQNGFELGNSGTVKKNPAAHKLNGAEENLIINQQFDDVLKLISQSIDEPITVSIQSAQSSTAQSSVNTSPNNAKANSSSSSSSGISEDFKLTNNNNNKITDANKQNNDQFQNIKSAINNTLNVTNPQFHQQQQQQQQKQQSITKRNSSDSAFSDSLSIPSSMSIVTLTTPAQQNDSINRFNAAAPIETMEMTPEQKLEFEKAEKIRIALEKLKEANIKKLIVKAYTDDGCTKSIIIDETMRTYDIMLVLLTKTHSIPTVKYTIIEYLPKLFMERIVEDHENLVEIMTHWSRDSENQIFFTEREDKYDLFVRPELYLLNEPSNKMDEGGRTKLLTEFFANIGSPVPEIEGFLYLKSESKKSWKKCYCILRQSGLYYVPKGKQKKDMQNLLSFDKVDLYYGVDWKKEYKAPTDFCFGLKYPQIQKVSPKYMKYMCCETDRECKRWVNGIRIAKFGKQLYDNYKRIYDLAEMSKISGFAALTNCRRLSASLNSRPKSSYSIGSNDKLDLPTPTMSNTNTMTKQSNLVVPHFTQPTEVKLISPAVNTTAIQQNVEFRDNKQSINSDLDNERPSIPTHTSPYKMLQQPFVPIKTNNEVSSLLCKLKPTRTSSMYSTTSTSSTGTLNQKTAKLPVTTGITRQMIGNDMSSLPPQNDDEPTTNSNQQFPMSFPATISKLPINIPSESVYDFPSPPAELLEPSNTINDTHLQTNFASNNITSNAPAVPSQQYKPIPPPKLPKPQITLPMVLQRNNSCDNRSSTAGENAPILRKHSNPTDNLNMRRSSNGTTRTSMSPNHNNNAPLVSEELNMILARQRKLIEVDTSNKTTNNGNENVSPSSQNKPVPPPRHDSTKLTGQLNNK